jgi:hypothetical protein
MGKQNPGSEKMIKIELCGETFEKKEILKNEGYVFNSRIKSWEKTATSADEAEEIIRTGVIKGYIVPKKIIPNFSVDDELEGKALYQFKKQIGKIWETPSKTIIDEIHKKGYVEYPFLNTSSYIFEGDNVMVDEETTKIYREKMQEHQNEFPQYNFIPF